MSVVDSLDEMMRRYANKRSTMSKQIVDDEEEVGRIDKKCAEIEARLASLKDSSTDKTERLKALKKMVKGREEELQVCAARISINAFLLIPLVEIAGSDEVIAYANE